MFDYSVLNWGFRATPAKPAAPISQVNSGGDNTHEERVFLRELMLNNPEAIQSEVGLMAMMTQFPQQF